MKIFNDRWRLVEVSRINSRFTWKKGFLTFNHAKRYYRQEDKHSTKNNYTRHQSSTEHLTEEIA